MNEKATIVENFPHPVVETEHVWIPMSDGTRLSARLWMPEDAGSNPVPAILEYIPYRKRDGTRVRDDTRHRYWAGHGYACVRLDIRGTGDSEGQITDEYALQEQDDGLEAIAWIAQQPWCTGKVGMTGISWGGFNALQVAARRPPALKAIITHCSTDDRYSDDVHWMGGCLLIEAFFWGSAFYHFMTRPADPAIVGDSWRDQWMARLENWQPPASHIWMRHQRRDDYWRHGSVCENHADIECAVYAVGGWEDGYSNAVPRMLAELDCPRKGLVGPWGHKYPQDGMPGPAIGFLKEALRWWDYWLKGSDTGIMAEPTYRVWLQEPVVPDACLRHVPGRWVTEPCWPSPHIETRRLHLGRDGLASNAATPEILQHRSPQSLGVAAGSWCPYGLGGSSPDLAIDQREDDGRSLTFDGPPLEEPLEILGAPVVRLRLSIDRPQGFVVVRLNDVAPDGTSRRVTFGLLNLSHRDGHEKIAPMVPGAMTDVTVQLNDIAHGFPTGHRLRVAIATAYWPMVWPSPERVMLSLDTAESTIDLPVRPMHSDGENPPPFGPVEIARPAATRVIEPASSARIVERNLATDGWIMRLVEDGGIHHIDAIDLDVGDGINCEYSISGDDPNTAVGTWTWHSIRRRAGWNIEIRSTTRLASSRDEFRIDTDVQAFEDGKSVFERSWRERIPRDGV